MSSSPEPEGDDTSAAMAAAMGFSSFGGPPSKKRRFNPHADAFTAPPPPPTTSANAIPLHPRDTTATAPSSASDGDLQAQIDAIVASGNATYGLETPQLDGHGSSRHGFRPSVVARAPNAGKGSLSGMAAEFHPTAGAPGIADGPSLLPSSSLPPPPAASPASQIEGSSGEVQPSSRGGGGGEGRRAEWNGGELFINPKWHVGYYDATTNENPWARLEAKMGLPPAPGTWLVAGAASSSSAKRGKGRGG